MAGPVCLVCNSSTSSTLHQLPKWRVLKCKECNHLYLHPLPSQGQLIEDAEKAHSTDAKEEIQEYFLTRNLDDFKDPVVSEFTKVLQLLENSTNGRRLLDIGSGDGTFSALAVRRGWTVVALDFSENAAKYANKAYGLSTLISHFPSHQLHNRESFDAVTMVDILEHIVNPQYAVGEALNLLKDRGVMYVNSPNHRSLLCWGIDIVGQIRSRAIQRLLEKYYCFAHVSIFEPNSLTTLLENAGFSVEQVGLNNPILGRFVLPTWLKLLLRVLLAVAEVMNLQSRVWVLARAGSDPNGRANMIPSNHP